MKTSFAAAPFTALRVNVFVHDTAKELHRAFQKHSDQRDESVTAFVGHGAMVLDGVVGDIHFSREDLSTDTLVHEAQHAALVLARYLRLDLEDNTGEELFATAMASITCSLLALRRRLGASKQPAE